jgi:amidohydrolase
MEQAVINTVRALRAELHELAERSGAEKRTKARLMEFLRAYTSLRLVDEGPWFAAIHRETGTFGSDFIETVAFRADMDALPALSGAGEGAVHLCGHDGHCAALAGLGLLLEGKKLGRNIVLIFQHAEETGEGGKICAAALEKYAVGRVYALHNIPGHKEGAVLLRNGTFTCASLGMTITMTGAPSHAAHPEQGRNPGFAAARLIDALPELTRPDRYRGLTMATLIGADIGGKAFGSAAAHAEVRLTLRAWHDGDLEALKTALENTARTEAAPDGVEVSVSYSDIFPATVNDSDALEQLKHACRLAGLDSIELPEPIRWSEDFGWYGAHAKTAMAGIGAGENWPPLHTTDYEFNDNILPAALALYMRLAEAG